MGPLIPAIGAGALALFIYDKYFKKDQLPTPLPPPPLAPDPFIPTGPTGPNVSKPGDPVSFTPPPAQYYENEAYLAMNSAEEAMAAAALGALGRVITKTDPLSLRNAPDGSIITVIPKGSTVAVLEEIGEWYRVAFGGVIGYAAKRYIAVG